MSSGGNFSCAAAGTTNTSIIGLLHRYLIYYTASLPYKICSLLVCLKAWSVTIRLELLNMGAML